MSPDNIRSDGTPTPNDHEIPVHPASVSDSGVVTGEEWTTTDYKDCFIHLLDETGYLLSEDFHDKKSANRVRDAHNSRVARLLARAESAEAVTAKLKAALEKLRSYYFDRVNMNASEPTKPWEIVRAALALTEPEQEAPYEGDIAP